MVTLCTSGAVKLQAGANYPTALTNTDFNTIIEGAEALLSINAKYDLVSNYSGLSSIGKAFLSGACACAAAFDVVKNNQNSYSSKEEAQVLLDANWTKVVEAVNLLRDDKFITFVIKGNKA